MNQIRTVTRAVLLAASLAALSGCRNETAPADSSESTTLTMGLMPKLTGIDYFDAVNKGAQEAAGEVGMKVVFDGPAQGDVGKQIEMVDGWIARKFDVIAISPNDPNAIAPSLKKAQERGVKVLSYDADAAVDARSYFVNQATDHSIGTGLVDVVAEEIGGAGEVAVITGSMTAANQNAWIDAMRHHMTEKYPGMKLVEVRPSEVDPELAYQVTKDLLKAYPDLKGIFAITSIALPQAARAVKDAGMAGKIAVTGLATPSAMKPFVADGTVKTFLLWSPVDLGYLTVHAAKALARDGKLPDTFKAGRLGDIKVSGTEVLLGPPTRFDKANIDDFDF